MVTKPYNRCAGNPPDAGYTVLERSVCNGYQLIEVERQGTQPSTFFVKEPGYDPETEQYRSFDHDKTAAWLYYQQLLSEPDPEPEWSGWPPCSM